MCYILFNNIVHSFIHSFFLLILFFFFSIFCVCVFLMRVMLFCRRSTLSGHFVFTRPLHHLKTHYNFRRKCTNSIISVCGWVELMRLQNNYYSNWLIFHLIRRHFILNTVINNLIKCTAHTFDFATQPSIFTSLLATFFFHCSLHSLPTKFIGVFDFWGGKGNSFGQTKIVNNNSL